MSLTATGSPYPSVHVIEGIYQYRTKLGHASFPDYLDEDVEITILGQDHKLGGTYKGKKAYQDIAYEFANTLDLSKFHKLDIVKVIGGGEQAWACVELKATGTTTAGASCHVQTLPFPELSSTSYVAWADLL